MKRARWRIDEQALFLKRIGVLLDQGYSITEAIDFIIIQADTTKRTALNHCILELKEGKSVYQVLMAMKFHPTAVSYIFYSEQNGNLAIGFQSAGHLLLTRHNHQMKLMNQLAYPIFLLLFTMMMFLVMQMRLLPHFVMLYENFQVEPNFILKIAMVMNEKQEWIFWGTIVVILLLVLLALKLQKEFYSYKYQYFLTHLPLVGKTLQLWNTYYFSFQLSQLLKSGFSLLDSLRFIENDPKKGYLNEMMKDIHMNLLNGETLYFAVKKVPLWRSELAVVIQHGQLSGKLEGELENYSQYCFEELFMMIDKGIKIIQPLIFLIIGLWLILLYFSIMLPAFQLIHQF